MLPSFISGSSVAKCTTTQSLNSGSFDRCPRCVSSILLLLFFLTSRFQARNGAERPQLNICARLISAFACLCCCCCAGCCCCCSSFTVGYCPSSQDYRGLPPSGSPRRRWKAREIGSVNRCVPARGIRCRSKRSRAPPSPLKASGN